MDASKEKIGKLQDAGEAASEKEGACKLEARSFLLEDALQLRLWTMR